MDFARPQALLLLLVLPPCLLLGALARKRLAAAWAALGRSGRPPAPASGRWVTVIAALVVALAGPRLGLAPGSELPRGHDVVLLIDASRSMAAEDVVPDRMGAAVSAAQALIRELARDPGERAAVLAFAGGVEPVCPLTDRLDAAFDSLRSIRPGSVRPGGTELGAAVAAALDSFDERESSEGRSIVVFTDGEDLSGSWPASLDRLRSAGVVVHGVTFGDSEAGHLIPAGPGGKALVYRGEPVLSRRSDEALSAICKATGGGLVAAGVRQADLAALYREKIAPSERARRRATSPPERVDRSSWLIAGALGLIGSWSWPRSRRVGTLAVLVAVAVGAGPPKGSPGAAIRSGDLAYRAGKFADALAAFEEAARIDPNSAIPRYNAAAARFQLGQYDEAEALYLEARNLADVALRAKIDYALGNVAVATGRFKESLARYDECLASAAEGPAVASVKRDAKANRIYAERRLPPPATPDPEGGKRTPNPNTDPKPGPDKAPSDPAPSPPEGDPGAGSPPPNPPDAPPVGRQDARPGPTAGATPPRGSPEDRLNAMLDEVRKGQSTEREGGTPPAKSETDRKDW